MATKLLGTLPRGLTAFLGSASLIGAGVATQVLDISCLVMIGRRVVWIWLSAKLESAQYYDWCHIGLSTAAQLKTAKNCCSELGYLSPLSSPDRTIGRVLEAQGFTPAVYAEEAKKETALDPKEWRSFKLAKKVTVATNEETNVSSVWLRFSLDSPDQKLGLPVASCFVTR
jgi:hypothetical protein